MTGRIEQRQQEFVDLFSELDDPLLQYELLMQIAGELQEYPEELKDDQHEVNGCQSKTWVCCTADDGRVNVLVDSEALIVKGMVGVVAQIMENAPLEEAAHARIDYIERPALNDLITSDRRNGIKSAVQAIRDQATRLEEKE